MNNRKIETLAISAVKDSIFCTDILEAYISDNDKTPSLDGYIYVYKSKSKEKDNIDGSVPVQVKGESKNDLSAKAISFSSEISDLRHYLYNGGAIFFVVRIHKEDHRKRKIYYETLTPVKLQNYLKNTEGKKRKKINLKEFPSDKNDQISIVTNFLDHSRKQTSFVGSFISLDEILSAKSPQNLTVFATGYGHNTMDSMFSTLKKTESYAYVINEGTGVAIPIDTPITFQAIEQEVKDTISVGDKYYYDRYLRVYSEEGIMLKIGDSLSLLMFKKNKNTFLKVDVCLSKYLRKATSDMAFIIDAFTNKRLNLGAVELKLDLGEEGFLDFIQKTEKQLTVYHKAIEMLDVLNVREDLNLDELTIDEQRNLEVLVKAFADKEKIMNLDKNTQTSVLNIRLSNIVLKLIVNKEKDGVYTIEDFFSSRTLVSYKDEDGKYLITSPYSALSKDEYHVVSNIDYDAILESYKNLVVHNTNIFERATIDLLNMLLAYDEKPNKELLIATKNIAHWIFTEGNSDERNVYVLNYLQIIKRERILDKNEKKQLVEISEKANANREEKIGAYLLLDNQVSAEVHFEELDIEQQNIFREYPIYKFWQHAERLAINP